MYRKNIFKWIGFVLVVGLLFQTAILTYANVFGGDDIDTSSVVISQEILDAVRNQDPAGYNKNIKNYKKMLVSLDVHETFKNEIERLVQADKKLTDLMVAFQFLNDCYGMKRDIEVLVNEKVSGKSWRDIFTQYNTQHPAFVPRSFDFDYLEHLTKSSGITTDDIMIADRVSYQSGSVFEEIIEEKATGASWKNICATHNVINSQNTLPRVPVTPEQLKKHTEGGTLTEDKVVETLVTAYKLGLDEADAIAKAKSGYTQERFFAEALEAAYY